jgi:hypothetical protein
MAIGRGIAVKTAKAKDGEKTAAPVLQIILRRKVAAETRKAFDEVDERLGKKLTGIGVNALNLEILSGDEPELFEHLLEINNWFDGLTDADLQEKVKEAELRIMQANRGAFKEELATE